MRITSAIIFSVAFSTLMMLSSVSEAQTTANPNKFKQADKFRQLEAILPTPNAARVASGAPGKNYWQQKVDYEIDIRLNDEKQQLHGKEKITYTNNSPDTLKYLWLQLDANLFHPESDANIANSDRVGTSMSVGQVQSILAKKAFDGSFKITRVEDSKTGKDLKHTIVKTMMRVDLPMELDPGQTFKFELDWNYMLNDQRMFGGRSGYEFFKEDGNYIYEMAQWFPRLCAYTDATGWQHKQFLGRGEFTLEMGDYVVQITVPDDHVVASTGVLLNPDQVLTKKQRDRLKKAETTEKPIFIVTPEEAKENESSKPTGTKTWIFKADQVRDFAWASSRKYIWDAMQHNVGDFPVMAMSFYPNEAEPLWSMYSTHAIIHTLEVYSRYTFDYPYPVAISVNGPVGGMEYPMICFNGPRPDSDGTYSASTKYGLISVIIHEVGHNYFPMIVNSDERQWTWMDEGLNTFLQFLAEQEWEENYPSRRGEPRDIVGYMRSTNQVPIMTNSESILQFGPNAYAKPATALNVLRETILGRELFDFAFKEYAIRWKFKRPMPADFFRTMEDASGVDLDWFWRGWFYSNDHVDLSIKDVKQLNVRTRDPKVIAKEARQARKSAPQSMSEKRNKDLERRTYRYPELKDFYNSYDPLDVSPRQREAFDRYFKRLSDEEKKIVKGAYNFYAVDVENLGGLVMPIILKAEFEDGSTQDFRYPAEIWRKNNLEVTKLLMTKKPVKSLTLDPYLETADVELENNFFPRRILKSRFDVFRSGFRGGNMMRVDQDRQEREDRRKRAEKQRKEAAKKKKEAAKAKEKAEEAKAAEAGEIDKDPESAKKPMKKGKPDAKAKSAKQAGKVGGNRGGKKAKSKSKSKALGDGKILKDEIKGSDT
jgi:hypothetical protein